MAPFPVALSYGLFPSQARSDAYYHHQHQQQQQQLHSFLSRYLLFTYPVLVRVSRQEDVVVNLVVVHVLQGPIAVGNVALI